LNSSNSIDFSTGRAFNDLICATNPTKKQTKTNEDVLEKGEEEDEGVGGRGCDDAGENERMGRAITTKAI